MFPRMSARRRSLDVARRSSTSGPCELTLVGGSLGRAHVTDGVTNLHRVTNAGTSARVASDRGPGQRGPPRIGLREPSDLEQPLDAPHHRGDLCGARRGASASPDATQVRPYPFEHRDLLRRERLARQSQSTVPAARHREKHAPWSTPWMCPPGTGSRRPALRSVLFTAASNTAMRRSRRPRRSPARRGRPSRRRRTTARPSPPPNGRSG